MRIGMLVYNDFVNDVRVHKEARDLAAAGHSVLVLATRTRAELPETEARSGYDIRRIPLSPHWRTRMRTSVDRVTIESPRSVAGRLFDRIRRNRLRRLWIAERLRRRFGEGALRELERRPPEVIHAHDLDTLDFGAGAAERLGVPLVYDSHELWRNNNFLLKAPRPVRERWRRREAELIGRARAVIITTEARAARLREWYPGVRPIIVMNCQDGEPTPPTTVLRDRLGLDPARRIVLYQGLMHADRGIFELLDALEQLPDEFVVVAIGQGADAARFARDIADRKLQRRAFYLPAVPHQSLPPLTASADYGVSLVQNTSESYYLSAPNKIFEFMRAGLPMVASDFPEIRRLWREADLGERVDPADPTAVARALLRLESDPARRRAITDAGHRLVRERYNWSRQMAGILEIYAGIETDRGIATRRAR